jgi:hypothetical protein
MNKYPLIGVSISAVVLLVLGSLSNVVGYQSVQSSNQQTIKEEVNQRELLFQTILDIANNKEIQGIILKSHISRGIFPNPDVKFSLTKKQLGQMYFIGLLLSKFINTARMQSIVGKYQFSNQEMQKELSAVIEKNPALKSEISQLQNSECDCGNKNRFFWPFPVICSILFLCIISLNVILLTVYHITGIYCVHIYNKLVGIIGVFATFLFCPWI